MSSPCIGPTEGSLKLTTVAGILLALTGIVLVVVPLGSSTESLPARDAAHVITFWIPGLLLVGLGAVLERTLLRRRTVVILVVALAGIWLMHPVCDPIAGADVPRCQTGRTVPQTGGPLLPAQELDFAAIVFLTGKLILVLANISLENPGFEGGSPSDIIKVRSIC